MATAAELLPKFRTYFPEFASETDAYVTRLLGDALSVHHGSNRATLHLAAHFLVLESERTQSSDTGAGEATAESIGRESVSLMAQAERGNDVFFTRSPYGRLYLMYAKSSPTRNFSVRVY